MNELKVKSEMWSVPAIIHTRIITDKLEQKLQEQRHYTMLLLIPQLSQSHICGMGYGRSITFSLMKILIKI